MRYAQPSRGTGTASTMSLAAPTRFWGQVAGLLEVSNDLSKSRADKLAHCGSLNLRSYRGFRGGRVACQFGKSYMMTGRPGGTMKRHRHEVKYRETLVISALDIHTTHLLPH
jgi:hypothetical protein